ncbi:MAG: GH3 auxin-responsive promoter family protein [Dehalococcoidia bacterium]|jgi:hypothetical protein|nr:GH3 auxin-responsive promoter family protein [Dehalococcoidia bacterium]
MTKPIELLREGRKSELWQMCCGFLDLNLEQFMHIQRRLMEEQLELLKASELGRKIMKGAMPSSIDEFRAVVPLTTYGDYIPELTEKREATLPAPPAQWVRTSGYTGKYEAKWIPLPERFVEEFEKLSGGLVLLCMADYRGDMRRARQHLKVLSTFASPPYASGVIASLLQQALNCDFLPSNAADLSFTDKVKKGFAEALDEGLDGFGGLPSVLVTVGEQLRQQSNRLDKKALLKRRGALLRVLKGLAKSRLAGRPMLPRDLWAVKGIIGGGTDAAVFKKRVDELWGRVPLEVYAGSEGGIYAVQAWDCSSMTFVPNLNFFEFIPEREHFKWQVDHTYRPKTVLLDEVVAGEAYEIIVTNLHGGALTRYRVGDVVRITSLRNEAAGIDIPQMVFERRADDLIDIAGFGRLTERVIWEAIETSGVPYIDWTARKELVGEQAVLHVYIEPARFPAPSEAAFTAAVYRQFRELDKRYNFNIYSIFGEEEEPPADLPLRISYLPAGAFSRYILQRQNEGADLGHLKPPHINPSDAVIANLAEPAVEMERVPVEAREKVRA